MKDQQPFDEWLPQNVDRMIDGQRQREQAEMSRLSRVGKFLKIAWMWIAAILFISWYLYNGGAAAQFG